MGNLADELDFADEEWDEEEDQEDQTIYSDLDQSHFESSGYQGSYSTPHGHDMLQEPSQTDGARDSGIDIRYRSSPSPSFVKFSNGPFAKSPITQRQASLSKAKPNPADEDEEEKFSLEIEQAMVAIARLSDPTHNQQADTTLRTVAALQDLGAQTTLETQSQRLATSMNSVTMQLVQESRALASSSATLFSPFSFAAQLDQTDIEDMLAMLSQLAEEIPSPDSRASQGLTKFDRDTTDLIRTLTGLIDSLQMGKQMATSAARCLRTTQTMVVELRREKEKADESRFWLEKQDWDQRFRDRWCASECKDVVSGFDKVCDGLRRTIEESAGA